MCKFSQSRYKIYYESIRMAVSFSRHVSLSKYTSLVSYIKLTVIVWFIVGLSADLGGAMV